MSEKSRKSRKVQLSDTKERKKGSCRLSIGEPGGLGKVVGEGRPKWESGVARKLAMRSHTLARGGSHRLKNIRVPVCDSLFHAGGLFRWVDRGETILMVGLPAGDEVTRKSCQRQEVLMVEVTSDSD